MHLLPLTSKRGGSVHLGLDIGSGGAATAVIAVREGAPARVLASTRVTLPFEDRTSAQHAAAVRTALADAGHAVRDTYAKLPVFAESGPITRAFAVFHAPWGESATRDSLVSFTAPTRITPALLEKAARESAGREKAGAARTILEQAIVHVELNGYTTAFPAGKIARSLRVITLESTVPADFLAHAKELAGTLAPDAPFVAHSAAYEYDAIVHERAPAGAGYAFLDIGSEASACYCVRDGAIAEQATVAAGTRSLMRHASGEGARTADELLSLIGMAIEGSANDAARSEVAAALAAAEPNVMRAFGEAFSGLTARERMPASLVIAIHPKLAAWATAFFGRLDFSQFTETGRPFTVEVMTPRVLAEYMAFGQGVAPDAGVAALAALVHIRNA
ncbi:MAG TPA: hypothetical protein VFL98_00605 [Candidatus Paceibacterota bacterium]|nr:hypothetical protein [Candidatus Paceibacterota bacterium]